MKTLKGLKESECAAGLFKFILPALYLYYMFDIDFCRVTFSKYCTSSVVTIDEHTLLFSAMIPVNERHWL